MRPNPLVLLVLMPALARCADDEVARPDTADTMDTAEADAPDDADGDTDSQPPPVPELRPIPAGEVAGLVPYVRQLRSVAGGGAPTPNAWSMVNWSCEDRAMAVEYAIAAAAPALGERPPDMDDAALTVERVTALAAAPTYDAASIIVAGPLVVYQHLYLPDGAPIPGPPEEQLWGYHAGVVINVAGELRVVDLSLGDAPVPIDTWLAGFVLPPIRCEHMADAAYWEVWSYWGAALAGWELPPAPAVLCGYQLTPLFTLRWDQTVAERALVLAQVPATLVTQYEAFRTVLAANHETVLPPEQIPLVTSTYQPRSIQSFCEAHPDMPLCKILQASRP